MALLSVVDVEQVLPSEVDPLTTVVTIEHDRETLLDSAGDDICADGDKKPLTTDVKHELISVVEPLTTSVE